MLILGVGETYMIHLSEVTDKTHAKQVTSLLIGKNVTSITNEFLNDFDNITNFIVEEDNEYFNIENDVLFGNTMRDIIYYSPLLRESVYFVPVTVSHVQSNVFARNSNLKMLIFQSENEVKLFSNSNETETDLKVISFKDNYIHGVEMVDLNETSNCFESICFYEEYESQTIFIYGEGKITFPYTYIDETQITSLYISKNIEYLHPSIFDKPKRFENVYVKTGSPYY